MKRQIIIGTLLTVTLGAIPAAWADCDCQPGGPEWQEGHRPTEKGSGQGRMEHEERGLARMAKALGLTDAQKAKFEGILQAERDKGASLRQKLGDYREQLRQAERAAKFDEREVRTIAAHEAVLFTEMTVECVRAQNQIHSLLTPEQRAIAEKLGPPMRNFLACSPAGCAGRHFQGNSQTGQVRADPENYQR